MAKKKKGFKVKQYKEPQEKFLVVVNPWGVFNNFDQADFNHISAWFELMLQEKHPGCRVRAIYYQRTHKNIIVELPSEVKDIEPYLGSHYYQSFLANAPLSTDVATVYEYRYSTFGDPSDKNFSMGYPMYNNLESVPSTFPVKREYPPSFSASAPPLDVPYARPIPPEVNERKDARQRLGLELAVRAVQPLASSSTSSAKLTPPHEPAVRQPTQKTLDPRKRPPAAHIPQQLSQRSSDVEKGKQRGSSPIVENKKTDPYGEESQAESWLRSPTTFVKNEAEKFLDNLYPPFKLDQDVKSDHDEYEMSDALRNAIRMLELPAKSEEAGQIAIKAKVKPEPAEVPMPLNTATFTRTVKPEPTEASLPDDSEYVPSDALVAAWNALSNGVLEGQGNRSIAKSEPSEDLPLVKQETFEPLNLHSLQQNIKREREINAKESGYEPLKRVKIEHQGA